MISTYLWLGNCAVELNKDNAHGYLFIRIGERATKNWVPLFERYKLLDYCYYGALEDIEIHY